MKIKKIDSSCIRVGLTFRPDIKGFQMLRCIYHDTDYILAVSVNDGKIYRITPGTPCLIYIDMKEGDIYGDAFGFGLYHSH